MIETRKSKCLTMKLVVTAIIIVTALKAALAVPSSVSVTSAAASSSLWKTLDGSKPKIYAHRGEKILMPEHTIPAYELASILGADYVEPDLCLTKDNELVCYHDLKLGSGTDVQQHPEFNHFARKTSQGGSYDWYIGDFTLAELKTLKVVQKSTGIRPEYFMDFRIPTFSEFLDTIHRMSYKLNRTIGIMPELKSPGFHNSHTGEHGMEHQLLDTLASFGYPVSGANDLENCSTIVDGAAHVIPCPPVTVQCFQLSPLQYLRSRTEKIELLYLAEEDPQLLTYKGMQRVSNVAQHYFTWKDNLFHSVEDRLAVNNITWNASLIDSMGGFIKPDDFVKHAHRLGMRFGVYTIYDSRETIPEACATTAATWECAWKAKTAAVDYFLQMGVDSLFVENVAESREILLRFEIDLIMTDRMVTCGAGVAGISSMRVMVVAAAVILTSIALQFQS